MIAAFKKRPEDFKRRVLEYHIGDAKSLFEKEEKWLSMISPHETQMQENKKNNSIRYYNVKRCAMGIDAKTASSMKKAWWNSNQSEDWREELSKRMMNNNLSKSTPPWNKNKKCPQISESLRNSNYTPNEVTRNKMSAATKKRWDRGDFKDRPKRSKESYEKSAEKIRGRNQTEYQKQRAREANLGKKASVETREKLRLAAIEREQKIVTCPHCNKIGNGPAMKRWHFSNCRNV
jgi:hypothetical protein